MEKPLEEAKIDGQDLEEGENVLDETAASSECAFRAQKTQSKLLSVRTISKRLIDKEDLEKRREDLGEMIQNASAEGAKAQGKVNRLTEKLESKNDKIKNLKRKLKEENEEKRKMREDYEFLIAEQKSLLESVKRFVKNLEGALKAEREEVKNLKKDKMEMIKEIQELKDQLNEGSPCAALQDIQFEVCPKQLFFTSLDKNRGNRASDPEFEYEQEGKKKRKVRQ
ncbi:uncharacterized protein [Malus domestica]|uniref:uncharacterized protein n=1 Tax=Malus domestica TaxID=3750 RepID=UPI0010AA3FE8|nr:intracellular protein transport protein USO1-like [Malus domestica]